MGEQKQQKPLGEAMARRCEEARGGVCHCRCGGRFHGRGAAQAAGAGGGLPLDFYNALPEDDPHWLPTQAWKDEQKRKKREAERERKEIESRARTHYIARNCRDFLKGHTEVDYDAYNESRDGRAFLTEPARWRFYRCDACGQIELAYQGGV